MNELRWIAQRVVDGLPVSVDVLMRELQVSERRAQDLMAGPWSELVAVIEAEAAAPQRVIVRKRCPRCRAVLIERRPGHVWCVCGYSDEPADERDKVVGRDEIECPLPEGKQRYRSADGVSLAWSDDEREAWRAYEAGEPVMPVDLWDRTRPMYVVKGEATPCEHCGKPLTKMSRKQHLDRWCPARKAEKAAKERPMVWAE